MPSPLTTVVLSRQFVSDLLPIDGSGSLVEWQPSKASADRLEKLHHSAGHNGPAIAGRPRPRETSQPLRTSRKVRTSFVVAMLGRSSHQRLL
jgi:hypothetical protein